MVRQYLALNSATVPMNYRMRRIEPILNRLSGERFKVFIKADAANGHWAVPLADEHRVCTALGCPLQSTVCRLLPSSSALEVILPEDSEGNVDKGAHGLAANLIRMLVIVSMACYLVVYRYKKC